MSLLWLSTYLLPLQAHDFRDGWSTNVNVQQGNLEGAREGSGESES